MTAKHSFETTGWLRAASNSYGADDLFRGTARTLVRVFPASDETEARNTYSTLVERGVTTATLDRIVHVDGAPYFYVWAERSEITRLVPEIVPEGTLG